MVRRTEGVVVYLPAARADLTEIRTAEGKLQLFVAIDRTSKFAFAQLVEKDNRVTASAFLVAIIEAVRTLCSSQWACG